MKRTVCTLVLCLFTSFAPAAESFVRYSPPDVHRDRVSLSGVWQFYPDAPEGFHLDPYAETLTVHPLPVPSEIEAHFPDFIQGVLQSAGFFRTVHIPAGWAGRRVKLRFEAVDGLAKIYVNGTHVADHSGPWTPFELDITDQVVAGEGASIALYVTSNPTTICSGRGYLGMSYEPELIVLPEVHLASLHLNPVFDAEYQDAQLELDLVVANESHADAAGCELRFRLTDANGQEVVLENDGVSVPAIGAGKQAAFTAGLAVTAPRHWDPEHPYLYTLETTLLGKGEAIHTVRHRVGFRQIEIRGNQVLLNGKVLKIRGVGYHHVPNDKTLNSVRREDFLRDMQLMKYANFNMVRVSPHFDLVEICDELGLMTAVETTVNMVEMSWMKATRGLGTNEVFYQEYQQMTREKVEAFRNHPSVIAWSIGNESLFSLPVFVDGARLTRELDPHRIVWAETHENEKLAKSLTEVNVVNLHYPDLVARGLPDEDRPIFYGEWCHVHEYAKADFQTDPAVRDHWVHSYEDHIDYMNRLPGVLGGFLFYGVDFTVRTPNVWNGNVERHWGILDQWRRIKPEFWHVKKSNSPYRMTGSAFGPDRKTAVLELRSCTPFTGSEELTFVATLNGEPLELPNPGIGPMDAGRVEIALPRPAVPGDRVLLDIVDTTGSLIDRYAVIDPLPVQAPERSPDLSWEEREGRLHIAGDAYRWSVDLVGGGLQGGPVGGSDIIEDGPFLAATRQRTKGTTFCSEWTPRSVAYESEEGGLSIKVTGTYAEATGFFVYQFSHDGRLDVSYDFEWLATNEAPKQTYHWPPNTGEMREVGVAFAVNNNLQRLDWDKASYWSWYPDNHIGRPIGSATCFSDWLPGYAGAYDRLPWHLEVNEFGSRDFRSTKTGIRRATLRHLDGPGALHFFGEGDQASRTCFSPDRESVVFVMVDQYGGGHEQFLQGNGIYSTPRIVLDAGTQMEGHGVFFLE